MPADEGTMSFDFNNRAARVSSWTARFSQMAQKTSYWTGHPSAFLLALAVILVWIVTGPIFHYSDTWQLVINTGTTIITFLMVFLIQNTQNRDMLAVQLKLSELVLAMKGAENKFAAIEDLTDEELEELHDDCRARAELTGESIERRQNVKSAAANGAAKINGNGSAKSIGNGKQKPVAARPPKTRAKTAHTTKT
jgi:low affinity Fe/Cu permease